MGSRGAVTQTLRAQPQQCRQIGQVGQALGLAPFGGSQGTSEILPIQQVLQSFLHALRRSKTGQIRGHLHLKLDRLTRLSESERRKSAIRWGRRQVEREIGAAGAGQEARRKGGDHAEVFLVCGLKLA